MKLLLKRGDGHHNSPDSSGQKPLSYDTIDDPEGVESSLSGSGITDRETSGTTDRKPTFVAGERASLGEVTDPFTATEHAPLNTIDDPLFGASISCPLLSCTPPGQPRPLLQSPPD